MSQPQYTDPLSQDPKKIVWKERQPRGRVSRLAGWVNDGSLDEPSCELTGQSSI